jgi:hypothetical protein
MHAGKGGIQIDCNIVKEFNEPTIDLRIYPVDFIDVAGTLESIIY